MHRVIQVAGPPQEPIFPPLLLSATRQWAPLQWIGTAGLQRSPERGWHRLANRLDGFPHRGAWVVIAPPDDDGPPPEQNNPPIGESQSVVTEKNTAVDITLRASDADGDPLSYKIISWPIHGILTGNGSARRYTPDPDYTNSDGFMFSVEDGAGAIGTATVDIQVVPPTGGNSPPVVEAQSVRTFRNTAIDITLKASDADGDPLSYNIASWPNHGALTGNGSARTYTPNPDYAGSDGFIILVEDGAGGSDAATVSINVKRGNGGNAKWRR